MEVASPFEEGGTNLLTALSVAHHKSGEKRVFYGPPEYIEEACSLVRYSNRIGNQALTLTEPSQQKRVCEEPPPVSPQKVDVPFYSRPKLGP